MSMRVLVSMSVIVLLARPMVLLAQAYCALRDPVHAVYQLFPDATSYRSIVRIVGDRAREIVGKRLPFELHHNELGRHTLYVPVDGEIPLGIVHVRSEASKWGLVEIVWAFDVDLRVLGFRFQRCRDSERSIVESAAFRSQIEGKNYAQLRALLTVESGVADSHKIRVPREAEKLAAVVLRSALKTLVVTEAVWGSDLRTIRLLARSRKAFPDATGVQLIENPYAASVVEALRKQLGTYESGIDRTTVDIVRLTDADDSTVGFTVRTDWKPAGDACVLWWLVSPHGTIVKIDAVGESCDRTTKLALDSLAGATIDRLGECATAVELAALEVLVVCRPQI